MLPVVIAAPTVGPPSMGADLRGLEIIWEGPDGQKWNLTDRNGGVILMGEDGGLEGLHNPRITKHSTRSPGVPGKRTRGWHTEEREVYWPLYIWSDGSAGWLARQREFFTSIHPDRPGTWRVRAGDEERVLHLTGVFDTSHGYKFDPTLMGWARYGIALEADQPYWEGKKVERGPWSAPASRPFLDPEGGPPVYISSASTFARAVVSNPGNVEAWGKWTAEGPLQDVVLGVAGDLIAVPFELHDGDTLVIDTNPQAPSATLNGEDATEELGLQDYAAVPPGEEVPLIVQATGAGKIRYEFTPLYFRAF